MSRVNNAIVHFIKTVEKAEEVIESGVVIGGSYATVLPLCTPAKRGMLSNVPTFIRVEQLTGVQQKHVVSFRHDNYLDLDWSFILTVDGFNHSDFQVPKY